MKYDFPFYTDVPMYLRLITACCVVFSVSLQTANAQEDTKKSKAALKNESPSSDSTTAPITAAQEVQGFEYNFPAMGTIVSFKAFHHSAEHVEKSFKEAEKEVLRISSILTDYDPQSETRQLTAKAQADPVEVSDELWDAIRISDIWFKRSHGAFDASLGNVTRLWRKYRRVKQIPDAGKLDAALSQSGWHHLEIDSDNRTIRMTSEVRLDFGAIGKGLIIDRAFGKLKRSGLACCMVNCSGNMRLGIAPPGREGWKIEVTGLQKDSPPLRRLVVANTAIATSGDLWQYIEINGQRRSHILDPRTGIGVLGPISATVLAATATDADAFATSACILPEKQVRELAQKLGFQFLVAKNQNGELELTESKRRLPTLVEN